MASEQVYSHAIFINNRKAVDGDAVSTQLIFNNLSGQNFCSHRKHNLYLRDMRQIWKTHLLPGDLVELRNLSTGQNEKRQFIGDNLPKSEQTKREKAVTSYPINWAI